MLTRERSTFRSAWTLVEVLIVVVIVSLLIVLLAPGLRATRDQARDAADMAKLSGHAATFHAYTTDYRESWPLFTDPRATLTILRTDGVVLQSPYFNATSLWSFALSETLGDKSWRDPSFFASARRGDPVWFTSFWHTSTLLADPAFWDQSTRVGPAQWRGTKLHEVLFTSHKGLLTRMEPWPTLSAPGGSGLCLTALADGHAVGKRVDLITTPIVSGEGSWTGSVLHFGVPTLHTPGGLRGRDIR